MLSNEHGPLRWVQSLPSGELRAVIRIGMGTTMVVQAGLDEPTGASLWGYKSPRAIILECPGRSGPCSIFPVATFQIIYDRFGDHLLLAIGERAAHSSNQLEAPSDAKLDAELSGLRACYTWHLSKKPLAP
jgi:hypothetical protein